MGGGGGGDIVPNFRYGRLFTRIPVSHLLFVVATIVHRSESRVATLELLQHSNIFYPLRRPLAAGLRDPHEKIWANEELRGVKFKNILVNTKTKNRHIF